MYKKSLKLINNLTSKSLASKRSSKFSLINEFLKRDKKAANQEPKIDESLVSKKILEEAAKKNTPKQEQSDIATRPTDKDHPQSDTRENKAISLQKELDTELDLPYKLYGTSAKAEKKAGYIGDRIFIYHKIPREFVYSHLNKIYAGFLHSIASRDEEFLREYTEANFCKRLFDSLDKLKSKGYTIKCETDLTGKKGEPIIPKMDFIDLAVIKGLNVDREQNKEETAYHKWVDIEDMGLAIYTPHEFADPNNFIDPNKNKTMYDDYAKVVFRVLATVESPLKLVITRPDGTEIKIDEETSTYSHTALFETQMKSPEKFTSSYKLENYMEWLGKFKFGVWKIADIDNWMLGNPLITKQNTRELYKDSIFKGSKYDPEAVIDIKRV